MCLWGALYHHSPTPFFPPHTFPFFFPHTLPFFPPPRACPLSPFNCPPRPFPHPFPRYNHGTLTESPRGRHPGRGTRHEQQKQEGGGGPSPPHPPSRGEQNGGGTGPGGRRCQRSLRRRLVPTGAAAPRRETSQARNVKNESFNVLRANSVKTRHTAQRRAGSQGPRGFGKCYWGGGPPPRLL